MTHCPEDDIKRLALGRVATRDSIRVQRHLSRCERCLRYLTQLKSELANQGLTPQVIPIVKWRSGLFMAHDTVDGGIFCEAVKVAKGKWVARKWGNQLQSGRKCKTMQEANAYLLSTFWEMFPEHRCSERCWASIRIYGYSGTLVIDGSRRPVHGVEAEAGRNSLLYESMIRALFREAGR